MSLERSSKQSSPRDYRYYIDTLISAGGYCGDPVGKCLRERFAVNGVPGKDIQYCMRDSDTFAAYGRGERLSGKFIASRAQQGWLIWIENFSKNVLISPHEVGVDWVSGVFHQIGTKDYGCVSDVRDCLYDSRQRKNLLRPATNVATNRAHTDAETDIAALRPVLDLEEPTTREALIQARRGQGIFRDQLISLWAGKCSLSKVAAKPLLRASHIKPWKLCVGSGERLDRFNGLLLNPNLDAAFDRGLISFSDAGEIMISDGLSTSDAKLLGIVPGLRLICVFAENKPFLAFHRQHHGFEPVYSDK